MLTGLENAFPELFLNPKVLLMDFKKAAIAAISSDLNVLCIIRLILTIFSIA